MVMFWKAVVLAALGLLFERWQAFKKKRQLTLRQSPDGVWRVDDRLERLETAFRRAFYAAAVLFSLYAVWVVSQLLKA